MFPKQLCKGSTTFSRNVVKRFYCGTKSDRVRKFSEDRALQHFDKYYSLLFGQKWKSIRVALLTKHKSVALVNNFADPTKICRELEVSGAFNLKSLFERKDPIVSNQMNNTELSHDNDEYVKGLNRWLEWSRSDYHKYLNATDIPIDIVPDDEFSYPNNLLIYSYKRCDVTRFQRVLPTENSDRLSHFAMNGSSILPPLMLNVQPDDKIYDACSSPGGKALLLLQTLIPISIVCNDIDHIRVHKIHTVFKQFLVDFKGAWKNQKIFITTQDARICGESGVYDKILVDVPCTTDRDAVKRFKKSNMFLPSRSEELLKLPELQTDILSNCLRLLKPGGSLVYSTCSISPVQNDGIVRMAIAKAFIENNITVTVKDLSGVIDPFRELFTFQDSNELRYGQLVLPWLTNNFGPMYFSKITRRD
ncbi:hypothetical protein HA402_010596 [Bradysia odoriphaga]|nr:hypothetical protein HA402_010596 [Bradysia odoriphaga]